MMKKRFFVALLAMAVAATSIPVPAMAGPVVSVTEISVSENGVFDAANEEIETTAEENSLEVAEDHKMIYGSLTGYIPEQDRYEMSTVDTTAPERMSPEREAAVSYPAKYDPRPENKVSAIRTQVGGTCWLFGSVAAIESNLIHQGLADHTIDLSELQIPYFLYHSFKDPLGYEHTGKELTNLSGDTLWDYMSGGGEGAVISFLETGVSPVYESEAPFWINQQEGAFGEIYYKYPTEEEVNGRVLDESLTGKKYFRLKDVHSARIEDRNATKSLITEYGAVTVGYYINGSKGIVREEGKEISYYSGLTSSQSQETPVNHCVAIVGWDDDYPKENFIKTPPGDGAWLVKQSYGPDIRDFNGTLSNGYEYISYYEETLMSGVAFEMEVYEENENIYSQAEEIVLKVAGDKDRYNPEAEKQYLTTYTTKADGCSEKLLRLSHITGDVDGGPILYLNPVVENGEVVSYSYKRHLDFDNTNTNEVYLADDPVYLPAGTTFGIYCENTSPFEGWSARTYKADMQCSSAVMLSKDSLVLKQGETATLSATVLPADTTMKGVSYHTTDEKVAVVDDTGKVTPTGSGICNIIAYAWDGKSSDSCTVSVRPATISLKDTTVGIGQTVKIPPVYPDGYHGESADQYSWSVSDTNLASINEQGELTGLKKGNVIVSAYLKTDPTVKASCSVKIVQPATGITFELGDYQTAIFMPQGATRKLCATVLPLDAEQTLEYTLEGLYGVEPVTYQNGILTAVTEGSATLTARVPGTDIKETIDIEVYAPASSIESGYSIDPKNVRMKFGEIGVLSFWVITGNPDGYHEYLSATSSNDKIVKVIQNPYITYNDGNAACTIQAVGAGSATITIKSNDSLGKTLVYHITVSGSTESSNSGSGSSESGNSSSGENKKKPATITADKVVYKFTGDQMTITSAVGNEKTYKLKSYITYGGKRYKVTKIGANAFKKHTNMTKVTIPSTVTKIDKNAFYGCKKLKTITIPAKVTSIGKKAFYGCSKLKKITIKSTKLKSVGSSAFKKIKKNATMKVPKKKLKAYRKLLKGRVDKSTSIKK